MNVKINQWHSVARWKWDTKDEESCGICRFEFEEACPVCSKPGDDCPIVWGECSHIFHMHCIMKWLEKQPDDQRCPMCRAEWKFKEK